MHNKLLQFCLKCEYIHLYIQSNTKAVPLWGVIHICILHLHVAQCKLLYQSRRCIILQQIVCKVNENRFITYQFGSDTPKMVISLSRCLYQHMITCKHCRLTNDRCIFCLYHSVLVWNINPQRLCLQTDETATLHNIPFNHIQTDYRRNTDNDCRLSNLYFDNTVLQMKLFLK